MGPAQLPPEPPAVPHRRSTAAQLVRYGAAGASSGLLYVALTLALSLVGVPIQVAIVVSYTLAVIVNFLLQRHFVFKRQDYALAAHHQAGYYVLVGAVVVGGSAAATTWLPGSLGVSEQVVYLGTVAVTPLFTYTMFRTRVFR